MNALALYNGTAIPSIIKITERIFQIETYDNETILCNIGTAKILIETQQCKKIKHYWNYKFTSIGKKEVKEMPL
jgi:hypothetical protein